MELDEGKLPDGKPYISKEPLLARRAPQVRSARTTTYGMGLMVDTTYGVPVVHHGGDMIGYHSDMMWLPEPERRRRDPDERAIPGWILRTLFRRKLLEVLFDGKPEADAQVASQAKTFYDELAAERKLLTVPADPAEGAKLAPQLHERGARRDRGDAPGRRRRSSTSASGRARWRRARTPTARSRSSRSGPGARASSSSSGSGPKKTLIIRDAQHEYVFNAS